MILSVRDDQKCCVSPFIEKIVLVWSGKRFKEVIRKTFKTSSNMFRSGCPSKFTLKANYKMLNGNYH